MLDWAEQVPSHAHLALKKKKYVWSENNYRYTIKTDSDKKTSKWVIVLDKCIQAWEREEKEYRQLQKEVNGFKSKTKSFKRQSRVCHRLKE